MAKYVKHLNSGTSQAEKAREDQVENSAGGFVFMVDCFMRMLRFLVLGSEGGTYYASEKKLTVENVKCIEECLAKDGKRTVEMIVDVSNKGRAPQNDAALLALAMALSCDAPDTKRLAVDAIPQVARIGTHLFHLMEYVKNFRGKSGRAMKRGIAKWYNDQNAKKLAYGMIKYRQRDGWTHADVIRSCHPRPVSPAHEKLFRYAIKGAEDASFAEDLEILNGFEAAQKATSAKEIVGLIKSHNLPREALPTQFLKEKVVLEALLPKMPPHALLRNLGNLGKAGILVDGNWDAIEVVRKAFGDQELITKSRLHPFSILVALYTYRQGHGFRSFLHRGSDSGGWTPVGDVVDILDNAFYMAFGNVEPAGKRTYIGLDVSGSMFGATIHNTNITAGIAAAAMSMITYKTENKVIIKGFCSGTSRSAYSGYGTGMKDLGGKIGRRSRLTGVVEAIEGLDFGGTDCALPIMDALDNDLEIDTFVVYTDNETWAGNIHPFEALKKYRKKTGIDARLVVVGMTATEFTIADPRDPGMLDVVGFDTASPSIISSFSRGEL
jgi:60 kDa SS-A/Ro ribonucleoprotein